MPWCGPTSYDLLNSSKYSATVWLPGEQHKVDHNFSKLKFIKLNLDQSRVGLFICTNIVMHYTGVWKPVSKGTVVQPILLLLL